MGGSMVNILIVDDDAEKIQEIKKFWNRSVQVI